MDRVVGMVLLSALLAGCGGGGGRGPIAASEGLSNVEPAVADGPYAQVLKSCALAQTRASICELAVLPPLRLEHPNPTTDDIMDRALVSHPWMAERLREVLDVMPEDMRYLFGSISAVVVDDDIRPSHYNNYTGAIYLDPWNFWLTEEELSVINLTPDYRSAFADPMNFRGAARYLVPTTVESPGIGRTLEEILPDLAALLFHELAHANDFVAVDAPMALDQTFADVTEGNAAQFPSAVLTSTYPLESDLWFKLASILFRGVAPSDQDVLLTAKAVGAEFDLDSASDNYGYTSEYEDLAMLFEEAMMSLHFDAVRDVAFLNVAPDGAECDEFTIGWGMRGRIGEPSVKERAQFAVETLLPEQDYSAFFASLPEPIPLPEGMGWCASENYTPATSDSPLLEKATTVTARRVLPQDNMLRRAPVVR